MKIINHGLSTRANSIRTGESISGKEFSCSLRNCSLGNRHANISEGMENKGRIAMQSILLGFLFAEVVSAGKNDREKIFMEILIGNEV